MIIQGLLLVESSAGETDEQFCSGIESLILQAYGHRRDGLRFSAGVRVLYDGRQFREFFCLVGSVAMALMCRARGDGGFDRAIIYRVDDNGVERAFEIRACKETEFNPDELHWTSPSAFPDY
jgi:hypothetical protein